MSFVYSIFANRIDLDYYLYHYISLYHLILYRVFLPLGDIDSLPINLFQASRIE